MSSGNLVSKGIFVHALGRIALTGFAGLALFGVGIDAAQAADVIRHSFAGGASDGNNPHAGLIQASDGNLYGTTVQGGSSGLGVYELSKDTSGNFTVFTLLHTFIGGASDGQSPQIGRLLQASDGNLYGTTLSGGSASLGTVYELSKDINGNFKVFTLLHSFAGGDGASPYAGLIQAIDGNLYGTTTAGGGINFGTVYELSKDASGNFTVLTLLRSFTSSTTDGNSPYAGLIQASDGNLYGATYGGGSASDGTAYELSKDGNGNFTVFTLLHSFTGCICATDGGLPFAALMQASDGNLYGTTNNGGSVNFGVAYELSKDASGNFTVFTVLHSFNGGATDGLSPYGGLIQASDGNLYGTTYDGGSVNIGTAYELSEGAGGFTTFAILQAFAGADGQYPYAGLLEASDGNLYGTTTQGGSQDEGVVYELQTGFSFFNFSLSPSPNSVTLTPGGAAGTSTITITPENSFTGSVTLSASGVPAGVTASFSPNPTTNMSMLSLTAGAGAVTGTVTVTIEGTSGTLVNSTTISLTVSAPATPTITFGPAPTPTYLGGNFTVSATTNSDGALTFSVMSGPCAFVSETATTGTFRSAGAGVCVVKASTASHHQLHGGLGDSERNDIGGRADDHLRSRAHAHLSGWEFHRERHNELGWCADL